MSKKRMLALPIVWAPALACLAACSSAGSASPVIGDSGVESAGPIRPEAGTDTVSYVLIDDMEGTDGHIAWTPPNGTRNGGWMSHTGDSAQNANLWPDPSAPWSYATIPTPYETFPGITSTHAARLHTTQPLANTYGGTMSIQLAHPADAGVPAPGDPQTAAPVDLTAYTGLTFWAMAAQDRDTAEVEVEVQDKNTSRFGGICVDADGGYSNCTSGFAKTLTLTGTFTQYKIDFADLAQQSWGYHPTPDVLDLHDVYSLFFQVNTPNGASSVTFDVWIDDLYLIRK